MYVYLTGISVSRKKSLLQKFDYQNFKFLNFDISRSFQPITNPKQVLESVNHELAVEIYFGGKLKNENWRIVIG